MDVFEIIDLLWIVAAVTWSVAAVALIAGGMWAARLAWRRARLLRRWSRELAAVEDWPRITSRAAHAEALHRLATAVRRGGEDQ